MGIVATWPCFPLGPYYAETLKMETVCFSETLVSTRCKITEQQHRHPHCRENLESHIKDVINSSIPIACIALLVAVLTFVNLQIEHLRK
jgi:hypothetical protein